MGNLYSKTKDYLKRPWPYWVGGILLGIMNVILLGSTEMTWHVTNGFLEWGASSILNIGVILGSLVATLLASQFKIKKIRNKKQVITALIGGICLGYGSKLAMGCNIGAFFSGIPSFSLHGWVFGIFAFLGVGLGIRVLVDFIL